jgi:hypothetical protein
VRVVFIDLVGRALTENPDQIFDITSVGFRPNVLGVIGRDGLERNKGQKTFLSKEFYHFAKLEGIAARTAVIA